MKSIFFLILTFLVLKNVNAQCSNIVFSSYSPKKVPKDGQVIFAASNECTISKHVIFSIEHLGSSNEWQEFDSDIFTESPKGMKIIKLYPGKGKKFIFKVKEIDPIFFLENKTVYFRIIANIYSNDLIQIVKTKTVYSFAVVNTD